MTILALSQTIADIIQSYMGLADNQVILKDEGFDAPKDQSLYVLIEYETGRTVAMKSELDSNGIETVSRSSLESFAIEVCSKGRDADARWPEVLMAFKSIQGQQALAAANISAFRNGDPLDLSAIEGAGALRRHRIPIMVSNVQDKTAPAATIDHWREPEVLTEA